MKVIDLLNKIANGEDVPKKIYCFNREFYLKENTYFGDTFTLMHYIQEEDLNEEVEIIEEEKKIPEKLILHTLSNNDSADFTTLQDFNNRDIQRTINWILDYLKNKGE